MARLTKSTFEELARKTEVPDLSGQSVDELRLTAQRTYAESLTASVEIGIVLAELRRREPRGQFAATCADLAIPRRTAYRWSDPFMHREAV